MEIMIDLDLIKEEDFTNIGKMIITDRSINSKKSNQDDKDKIVLRRKSYNLLNETQKTGYFYIPNQNFNIKDVINADESI